MKKPLKPENDEIQSLTVKYEGFFTKKLRVN
jgi:hypothetical protein